MTVEKECIRLRYKSLKMCNLHCSHLLRIVKSAQGKNRTFPLSSLPFLLPSLPLPSFPLVVGLLNPARGYGEHCKLPQRGLGQSPAEIEFGAF